MRNDNSHQLRQGGGSFVPRLIRKILRRPSSQKDVFRLLVISLVVVYGIFFYQIATTTHIFTHHDHPTQDGNTIYLPANQFPLVFNREEGGDKDNHAPLLPIRNDWVNGIVEGNVYKYTTSQTNLWDHSTVIPPWMKGKLNSVLLVEDSNRLL